MKPTIESLGIQIVDHCNLNSGVVYIFAIKGKNHIFIQLNNTKKTSKRLHEIVNINTIRIYGGEPLLHPQLCDFLCISRKEFESANIYILTNGLLLNKITDDLVEIINDCNIHIQWSKYPVFDDEKFETIIDFLNNKCIKYEINNIEQFYTCFDINGGISPRDAFDRCNGKNCHIMQNGKISICPAPMVNKIMKNLGFKEDFSDGLLNIHDVSITSEKLMRFFNTPNSACSYCTFTELFYLEAKWIQLVWRYLISREVKNSTNLL